MNGQAKRAAQALTIVAVPVVIFAFSAGPPIKRTGAPIDGGLDCTACHRTFAPANTGSGRVTIAASPYTPGAKQTVTVTVEDPDAMRFGFQITARPRSDETKQAGTFAPNDAVRVRCDPDARDGPCNGALEFAEHTLAGTRPGNPGPRIFTMDWTAPDSDVGDVVFYAAGNGANNNNANTGDHIYTTNLIVPSASADNKPAITSAAAVVNSASFDGSIAQNTWISIFGRRLSSTIRLWRQTDFKDNKLPLQLENVSAMVNGKPAYVAYVSPEQLNILTPPDTAEGPVQIQVTVNGAAAPPVTITLRKYAPALFMFNQESRKYIAATHANGTLLGKTTLIPGSTTPAAPGETITLYATGLGATNPAFATGELIGSAINLAVPVTVNFGSMAGQVSFAGLTMPGLYQINVKLPDNVSDGDVPVTIQIGGLTSQSNAFVSVQR